MLRCITHLLKRIYCGRPHQFYAEKRSLSPMRIYHTSNIEVAKPNIKYSRNYLDFGRGFYCTILESQAIKYGQRFIKKGENAYLNIYELDEIVFTRFTHKKFEKYDSEWLDFVLKSRKGISKTTFDIIEGVIADDQVFDTIDLYFSGIYTREQALNQLMFKKPNHQICITNQSILNDFLTHISSQKL